MNKEELIKLIDGLKLDKEEYWILSSSALVLREIYPDASDLDIAVTEKGLEELNVNYNLKQKDNGWFIVNDKIECMLDTKEEWKIERYDNYLLESIEKYYRYLLSSEREKDKLRIPLVENYIMEKNLINDPMTETEDNSSENLQVGNIKVLKRFSMSKKDKIKI